ncbi:20997_t:CDS:2, partial [Dentiscutata erythropus]
KCSYCPAKWSRGELQKLEAHLALECPNVDNEIWQIYLLQQSENITGLKKQKLNNQPNLTKYFLQKAENLSEERISSINGSLLKAFVVCALDGWTSSNRSSIYSFMILTPMHIKFLYSLKDFSANSHTAGFLADEINIILNEIGSNKFAAIVTDNASNVKLAWQIIHKKHPNILSLNCIAHCINLISKDIL